MAEELSRRALLGGGLLRGARARFDAQAAAPVAPVRPAWTPEDWRPLAVRASGALAPVLEGLALEPGAALLDVALDEGPLAAAAAARGAAVTRVAPNVAPLPFAGESFDAAGSLFDIVHARDPRAIGRELARVVRPGARLALATWASGGAVAALLRLGRGSRSGARPERWGTYEGLMLALDGFPGFQTEEHALRWTFADRDGLWDAVRAPFADDRRDAVEAALDHFTQTRGGAVELRVGVVVATAVRG